MYKRVFHTPTCSVQVNYCAMKEEECRGSIGRGGVAVNKVRDDLCPLAVGKGKTRSDLFTLGTLAKLALATSSAPGRPSCAQKNAEEKTVFTYTASPLTEHRIISLFIRLILLVDKNIQDHGVNPAMRANHYIIIFKYPTN